jgi:hypothetical protein
VTGVIELVNKFGGPFNQRDEDIMQVLGVQLRGHNDMPFRRPTPGQAIGRPGVGRPQVVFGVFSYYQLVILISNIVPLCGLR